MKVLIFGATGFLGSHLCEELLKKQYEVGIYFRENSTNMRNIKPFFDDLYKCEGVFAEELNFDHIVKGYDIVYQLISTTVPSKNDPLEDIELTIKPMVRLIAACKRNNVKKIIFFSSGGTVYGIPHSIPIKETHPTDPISAYGIQKLVLEKYLEYYYRMFGMDYMILRISNPYGERQRPFSAQGLIANILGHYFIQHPIKIWGDGSVIRDYIYVQDVVEVAERVIYYNGCEKIFNIGSGQGHSVNEIINIIDSVIGDKVAVQKIEARRQDVPSNVLDIGLVKQELGWSPTVNLEMGITKMYKAWNPLEKLFI
ncbi:UDP-glucose 4-epimerase [Propionispira arboris]|uniref:UDP-glucose 4-epimerase n=1 Tax=Propionispira arboris TaxID=84035 RepID=A0A1H7CGV4_9FIRM|nr:NAD-dependent epimerase/dehydratase family protein [Propionispira arboris]SEJ87827.1 UDP-glucose 4-epimerase [Propionispira arboris]